MTVVPMTPSMLAGDVLEAYHRQYLDGSDLAAWAEALLQIGFDSDSIVLAMSGTDLHWQEVPPLFLTICREIGLSPDASADLDVLKQKVMIEEYRHGYRRAAELFHRFDSLRTRAEFPEYIVMRLLEGNPNETNDSGYYGGETGIHGAELETLAQQSLEAIGVFRL